MLEFRRNSCVGEASPHTVGVSIRVSGMLRVDGDVIMAALGSASGTTGL